MVAIYLSFDALQSEPDMETLFLSTGGAIAAASSRGSTDLAVTGSKHSTVAYLSPSRASRIVIELPPDQYSVSESAPRTIVMSNRCKLLCCNSVSAAAINGSIVSSVSGQAAQYLSSMLRGGKNDSPPSAVAVPLVYSAWQAHSAVLTLSDFRLYDKDSGENYNVFFETDPKLEEQLKRAKEGLAAWVDSAYEMRQQRLVYQPSVNLSKSVARVPVGASDSGYSLLHDVVQPLESEITYATLNSMLKHAILFDLDMDPQAI